MLSDEPTAFIGRVAELSALQGLLDEQRLVTVCGPGGVGKTRLAQRAVRGRENVVYCELSSATNLEQLCAAIADALWLKIEGDPWHAITRALQHSQAPLLLLDNFEQLTHFAPSTVQRWLGAVPGLRMLVTSREPLRLLQEQRFELGPMALPELDSDLPEVESSSLLLSRLRVLGVPPLQPAEHAAAVAIVRGCEGLPLAIELAAAHVPLQGLSAVQARMSQPLSLLYSPLQGVPTRQQSLRACVAWSLQLCTESERRLLAQLAVFRGGFRVAMLEPVFGQQLLDDLRVLHDRSLLRRPSVDRFDLYESVREVVCEQPDLTPAQHSIRDVHARCVIDYASRLSEQIDQTSGACAELERERLNLELALEWAIASRNRPQIVAGALAFASLLRARGPAGRALEFIERALSVCSDEPVLLQNRARTLLVLGRIAEAERDLQAALGILHARQPMTADDRRAAAFIYKDLGVLHHQRRDVGQAKHHYMLALTEASEQRELQLRALCTGNLGALEHDVQNYALARELYEQSLALLRRVGARRPEAVFIGNLGILEQETGHYDAAERCFVRAHELLLELGDRAAEAVTLSNLAALLHLRGELESSETHHRRALELSALAGDDRSVVLCRARLAAVLSERGQLTEAEREIEAGATLGSMLDDSVVLEVFNLYRGLLELAQGRPADALARIRRVRATGAGGVSIARVSDDARTALQLLERNALKQGVSVLTVTPSSQAFRVNADPWCDITRHPWLARLLERLCVAQLDTSDSVDLVQLFEAGWPGESVRWDAATNRLHVALAKLRKLGLAPVLQRTPDGYRFDPSWLIVRRHASLVQ